PNQFSLRFWSKSDSDPCRVGVTCQLSTRRSKSWRVRPDTARGWLAVALRGGGKAKRGGGGRTVVSEKSSRGGALVALCRVASKDSTLASRDGSLVRARAPGL